MAPLHAAVRVGSIECVELLLAAGADVNTRNYVSDYLYVCALYCCNFFLFFMFTLSLSLFVLSHRFSLSLSLFVLSPILYLSLPLYLSLSLSFSISLSLPTHTLCVFLISHCSRAPRRCTWLHGLAISLCVKHFFAMVL